MIPYLLHSSILIGGVVLFYWAFLRHETFFTLNRWTLVGCIVLSLCLPLITVPSTLSIRGGEGTNNIFTKVIEPNPTFKETTSHLPTTEKITEKNEVVNAPDLLLSEEKTGLAAMSFSELLIWAYCFGVLVFFLLFVVQLTILLTKMYSLNAVKTGYYRIVELIKDDAPYSFWNTIFINPTIYDPDTYEQIIEHEKLHIDQAHFVDKLLAELIVIIFWFNPFAWVLRNTITNNLEYLTDETLLRQGMEKKAYQMSLLKVSVSHNPYNLTTNYNNSFLKNRIMMMNSKKSSITSAWKYLFVLPLFFLSVISLNAIRGGHHALPVGQQMIEDNRVESTINTQINEIPVPPTAPETKTPIIETRNEKVRSKRTLRLDPINKIANTSHGTLILTQGAKQEIRIEGPDEVINNFNTEVVNGEWKVGMRKNYKYNYSGKNQKLIIYATLTDLQSVVLSGSGNIESTNRFNTNGSFRVVESGSGNMELALSTGDLNCILSGSGNVKLTGSADEMDMLLSGSGNLDALALKSKRLKAISSGSGNMKVNVEDTISVMSHSGSGDIYYKGNPGDIENFRRTGSGKIRSID